jgi:two-component system NtrC family sensor kinase
MVPLCHYATSLPEKTPSGTVSMQTAPQLMLLRENGYKVIASPSGGNGSRHFLVELQHKIARVEEGDLDVAVSFANRKGGIGDLGRCFNHMVQQLRERRDEIERLHCNQLARAEHLAMVGELAAGLAHEIRNPLAGIAGVTEIVGRDLPATSPAHAVVKDVHREIARINRILTDLLQMARPHPPEIRPSDLNATVENAVMLARQHAFSMPIKIELEKDPNLPNVEHDSDQVHQLLLNLLLNAVQSIDGAGAIRVEISSPRDEAAIVVIDTGRGIASEHLPNIFRPFYTTKGNGTGLGLSLAHRIAEEHHGRIEVTSEVGKGTTFLVVLPLRQDTGLNTSPSSSPRLHSAKPASHRPVIAVTAQPLVTRARV